MTFFTPEAPGRVVYTLYVMSDAYLGLDQQYDLCLEVVEGYEEVRQLHPNQQLKVYTEYTKIDSLFTVFSHSCLVDSHIFQRLFQFKITIVAYCYFNSSKNHNLDPCYVWHMLHSLNSQPCCHRSSQSPQGSVGRGLLLSPCPKW